MTKEELQTWFEWQYSLSQGWHMSERDWRELVRINHLVMQAAHKIHNDDMMRADRMATAASDLDDNYGEVGQVVAK